MIFIAADLKKAYRVVQKRSESLQVKGRGKEGGMIYAAKAKIHTV